MRTITTMTGNRAGKRRARRYSTLQLAMIVILLVSFALGAEGLNADVVWSDELYSVVFMGAPDPPFGPAQIIATLQIHSPDHMPLYYIIGSVWSQIVGWSHFSLRFLSLIAGVLMIAWLYRFSTDALNPNTALVAAVLMMSSSFVILYFHELRPYTFFDVALYRAQLVVLESYIS